MSPDHKAGHFLGRLRQGRVDWPVTGVMNLKRREFSLCFKLMMEHVPALLADMVLPQRPNKSPMHSGKKIMQLQTVPFEDVNILIWKWELSMGDVNFPQKRLLLFAQGIFSAIFILYLQLVAVLWFCLSRHCCSDRVISNIPLFSCQEQLSQLSIDWAQLLRSAASFRDVACEGPSLEFPINTKICKKSWFFTKSEWHKCILL